MNSARVDSSRTSTQLWAVSSDGAVYVLQDVGAWLSSIRSNEVLHAKTATLRDNWTGGVVEGSGTFDRVICGAQGLVFAKKDKTLYVRRGITYDNPLGTTWAKVLCDARDLAVGSKSLVRSTKQDQLFVTEPLDLSSTSSVFVPHWNSVPACEHLDSHRMFVMDARDNLYLISPSSGEVFVCPNLSSGSPDNYKWRKLIEGPPPIKKQSSILNILGWGSSKASVFSSVSAGDGCLWFVGSSGSEMFQLVLNYVKVAKKRTKKKKETQRNGELFNVEASWKRFELPDKDEVTLLAADWTELDVLCAIVRENRTIVSYAALQENSGRVVVPNPDGFTQRWKSLSICAVSQHNTRNMHTKSTGNPTSKKSYPSIYPRMFLEDHDLCCEDGTCSFCTQAAHEANNSVWSSGVNDEQSSLSESMEKRKRESVREEDINTGRNLQSGKEGRMVTARATQSHGAEGEGEPPGAKRFRTDKEEMSSSSKGRRKRRRERGANDQRSEATAGLVSLQKKSRMANIDQIADIPFKLFGHSHPNPLLEHQVHSQCYFSIRTPLN